MLTAGFVDRRESGVTNVDALTSGAAARIEPRPNGPRRQMLPLDTQVVDFAGS